jgi:hypothetical protein
MHGKHDALSRRPEPSPPVKVCPHVSGQAFHVVSWFFRGPAPENRA